MKAGIVLNCVCQVVLQLALNSWGHSYFNLGAYPSWAFDKRNQTIIGNLTALAE